MRCENLPGEGHDKVIGNVVDTILETRRRNNVTLRRGGDVLHRRCWVFHSGVTGDVGETYKLDVVDTYN